MKQQKKSCLRMHLRGSIFEGFLPREEHVIPPEPHPYANYNISIYLKEGGYDLFQYIKLFRHHSQAHGTAKFKKSDVKTHQRG